MSVDYDIILMMNKEQQEAFQKSIRETLEKSAKMIKRIDNTLEGVKDTIADIQETNSNIDKIKESYNNVMNKLAHQIANSLFIDDEPFKKKEGKNYEHLPQKLSFDEITKRMIKHQTILIMTGAGVSAPSGIPTFRGQNGLYSKKFQFQGSSYDPQEFITNIFYSKHPAPIWEWVEDIYNLSLKSKPNQIHVNIDLLAKALNKLGKKVVIVTQNIDDLHLKPLKDEYEYWNIHGNVKYVRCCNLHLTPFEKYLMKRKEGDMNCEQCKEQLRPHVLFFDQSYGPLYGEEVKERSFPFVFVIGSSLKTNLCIKLTKQAEEVVEINPEPVIEIGRVYPFKEDTAKVVKGFLDAINKVKPALK